MEKKKVKKTVSTIESSDGKRTCKSEIKRQESWGGRLKRQEVESGL